jgi:hypothetical protein
MNIVTLHDGREVPSDSMEWALECEAKALLRLELSTRRAELEAIEKKRGKASTAILKERITAIWKAGRK